MANLTLGSKFLDEGNVLLKGDQQQHSGTLDERC
jgi:hypothetical protein